MSRVISSKLAAKLALVAWPCLLAAACSSAPSGDSGIFSKPSSFFATPDWMRDTVPAEHALWRPVSPEDYAGADGRCAGGGVQPAASGPEGEAAAPKSDPLPPTAIGIGLGMSECEVIRRAGPADDFQIGTNERGERMLTLTYLHGNRPGIYRFQSGRLASIERGPEPPAPPKVVKPKPKPKTATVARPQPAPQPAAPPQAGSAPWPSPQPAAQPQAAPWPQPGRQVAPQAPQSSPWPSSQPAPQSAPWPAPAQ